MRRTLLAALFSLFLVPASAAAQASDVREYLEYYIQQNFSGWTDAVQMAQGSLDEDEWEEWTWSLAAGQYIAVAACDDDCNDADIFVYQYNQEIARDRTDDDFPWVQFTSRGGDVTVRTLMYSCSIEPCYFAIRILN